MSLQHLTSAGLICFILIFAFFMWPNNSWHSLTIHDIKSPHKALILCSLFSVILISILPMSLSPYWNGTLQEFADKQQYDRMGDALLQGHLYIDNGDIDPALEAMKNPYDVAERKRLKVSYHWDEAYYNHHYYMYFGVVPTIILFIPFKLITGTALLSYQATQIFATLTIIGFFYLFYILSRRFFPKFPFSQYLLLSSAFSILSIGYSIAAPALYCTAIVSGICMMVWSIICFFKGAWVGPNQEIHTGYLITGALLGALAFGCRPPVAIANILLIAVIRHICQNGRIAPEKKKKTVAFVLFPYIIIGILLMLYNYARFDNVFEFGQSYQLTLADQHNYGNFIERFNLKQLLHGLLLNFYAPVPLQDTFPFLQFSGVFLNYPILLLSAKIFAKGIAEILKERKLYFLTCLLFLVSFFIALLDVYWSPFLSKRYHLDILYLLSIVSFVAIAAWLVNVSETKKNILLSCLVLLSFYVFVAEFLFFCIPFDGSYTMYNPEALAEIYKGLRFGF